MVQSVPGDSCRLPERRRKPKLVCVKEAASSPPSADPALQQSTPCVVCVAWCSSCAPASSLCSLSQCFPASRAAIHPPSHGAGPVRARGLPQLPGWSVPVQAVSAASAPVQRRTPAALPPWQGSAAQALPAAVRRRAAYPADKGCPVGPTVSPDSTSGGRWAFGLCKSDTSGSWQGGAWTSLPGQVCTSVILQPKVSVES